MGFVTVIRNLAYDHFHEKHEKERERDSLKNSADLRSAVKFLDEAIPVKDL